MPLGDINISSLVHEHNRASALADAMENGVIFEARSPIANRLKEYTFEPDMAKEALGLWRQILIREAETQAEILGQREGDRF